jgi:hypothetical protein
VAFLGLSCSSFGSDSTAVVGDGGGGGEASASAEAGGEGGATSCGRPGHDCLGGACEDGQCLPVELSRLIHRPYYLTHDATGLFVTSNNAVGSGGLFRVDKQTGATDTLAPGAGAGATLSPEEVFFCDTLSGRIVGVNRVDGLPRVLLDDQLCDELAYADGMLYYTQFAANRVRKVRTDTANPSALVIDEAVPKPEGIKIDATHLYVALHGGKEVVAYRMDSGVPVSIDRIDAGQPRRLAIDETHVYWVAIDTPTVRRVQKDGGDPINLAIAPNRIARGGIALDETHVYWVVARDPGGVVMRAAKSGAGLPEVLAKDLEMPIDVAVDDTAIYFTVNGLAGAPTDAGPVGKVMRLAKP